jgi:hypothetical protein
MGSGYRSAVARTLTGRTELATYVAFSPAGDLLGLASGLNVLGSAPWAYEGEASGVQSVGGWTRTPESGIMSLSGASSRDLRAFASQLRSRARTPVNSAVPK